MSSCGLGADDACEIADGLCANGAMVTVNVMGNSISKEQLAKLQEMMKAHPTIVSLCGIADDATKADLSGLRMGADDAAILANELPAKGALTSLNVSNNMLCGVDSYGFGTFDASGVTALADAIGKHQ